MSASLLAADNGSGLYCHGRPAVPPRPIFNLDPGAEPDNIRIGAAFVSYVDGRTSLSGNVEAIMGSQQLKAIGVDYDSDPEVLNAEGSVEFWDEGLYLAGSSARFELRSDTKIITDAAFGLSGSHGHGSGQRIIIEGDKTIRIEDGNYTTCDSEHPFWKLRATDFEFDQVSQIGTARQVRLELLGVPVLYSPYLRFATGNRRSSGFLTPKLKVSGSRGIEAIVPYYFNLAPNYDATVIARGMSERGLQLQGEFRYLQPYGGGRLAAEVLPNDRKYGDDRFAVTFGHHGNISDRLTADINLNWLSDQRYLEDLDNRLSIASQALLERQARLLYRSDDWYVLARLQGYQIIDPTITRPYQRLPQLYVETNFIEINRRLNWNAEAEFVHFKHQSSVTGTRLNLRPKVWFPIRESGGFLVPQVSLDYTRYWLDHLTVAATDDSPERLLPTLSIDGGLFIERDWMFDQRAYTQTLEPRIFYLLIPYADQSSIPNFDSGRYDFNFAQLFRSNRFSGGDRVGDANQLSLALTSRLFDAYGNQRAYASIGQIRYLRDRRVKLASVYEEADQAVAEDSNHASVLVTKFTARIDHAWRLEANYHYDSANERTSKHTWALHYQPDPERVVNATYRFVRTAVEQADLSVIWPLAAGVHGLGRLNYALADDTVLDAIAGVFYESCCWGIQAVVRHYLKGIEGDHDTTLLFQFILKGLGSVGRVSRSFIEENFPGYDKDL